MFRTANKTSFKIGSVPWNKGLAYRANCLDCGVETSRWSKRDKPKRCKPCMYKAAFTIKELHPRWKGGISRTYKTGYYSKEYKEWRKAVFERDGYACRVCGVNGYITAHHIKSFANYPELRFELDNGMTLCEPCHSLTDNYKGRNKGKLL